MPRSRGTSRAAASRPETAERIARLARNLWWTWNPAARRVLESLDPAMWRALHGNPIATLRALSGHRLRQLESDRGFDERLSEAEASLKRYLTARAWHARAAPGRARRIRVAYFCMEYGIHECLPLYAGGLGILAGDHLKSASDLGVPLVAVGILWRHGYYRQEIGCDGSPRVLYPPTDFDALPIVDTGRRIAVPIGRERVRASIWLATVGRIALYLLDADVPENSAASRRLTHRLYEGGDADLRVRQEILLGVGGLNALDALQIKPTVFHLNEGHAAFCPLERVARLTAHGVPFGRALDRVRASSVFTTHTPVPAGHDRFDARLVMKYFGSMPRRMGVSEAEFLSLGREDPADRREPFCMTVLALKLADRCNGVARLHGDTSRRMWQRTYGAPTPDAVPIGHVTNGIHCETWLGEEARPFYDKWLGPTWVGADPDADWWKRADRIPPAELWALRQMLRRRMIVELRLLLREQAVASGAGGADLLALYDRLDENALTIGFARRFAPYKRAPLIFRDERRLARILNDSRRPVQIIYAGKAHPMDREGQDYVREVARLALKPLFRGRVFIVQNYDMAIGRLLSSGCDLWLNNPRRPLEASGTSGMKPVLNAGLNCSVLDGWWDEAFDGRNGWQIGGARVFNDRRRQDAHDARSLYRVLEDEIVPTFYDRDSTGVPRRWTRMAAHAMQTICARFSSHRMLAEYCREYYRLGGRRAE